ncbi:MAG: hypothetical protein K6F94_09055 [Bacteroidaceae bacterium]|nr:hypothetical protein [Bacteroidaceae bacterium]
MTKTVELQIEKSRALIKGLRKHLAENGKGTNQQDLSAMEQSIVALTDACGECERLRAELSPKVKYMNELLDKVKAEYASHKPIIKNTYPSERWIYYGLPDKR